jgi:hypothetical protein
MSLLPPAYRGAPYHQPGPLSRRYRARRIFLRVMIVATVLSLFIIIGVLLTRGGL